MALFDFILYLGVLVGLFVWLASFWKRRTAFEAGYSEIHLVRTQDGATIALYRYPPEQRRYGTPVLLCHGLGANRFNFDLGPSPSLARYLQGQGLDVWSVELRGRRTPDVTMAGGEEGFHVFDDYVRYDAVAAVIYVKERTGASCVHWVGHSMGGLVLYGILQGDLAQSIASGVAIGSPGSFRHVDQMPMRSVLQRAMSILPRLNLSLLSAGLAPLIARLPLSSPMLFLNPGNVDDSVMERAMCHLVSRISKGEVLQMRDWIRARRFRSFDGTYSYEENLSAIRQPMFFLAGARDLLVPLASVLEAHDRVGSVTKDLCVLGREHGEREDYGHGDLLIGRNSNEEVFPRILQWIDSIESARGAGQTRVHGAKNSPPSP